jgi:S-adenosylmethionine decarboxylase proenzyme
MSRFRNIFIVFCLLFTALAAEEAFQFKGVHFLASYCDCDLQALTELDKLADAMKSAVEKSGATVLEISSWAFPPNGLTMVLLLSESHASIHTYPEYGSCFVDLFTCGEKCSADKFDTALREYLKPKAVNLRTLIRNEAIQEKE